MLWSSSSCYPAHKVLVNVLSSSPFHHSMFGVSTCFCVYSADYVLVLLILSLFVWVFTIYNV